MKIEIPSLHLHKASGQGRVKFRGKHLYFGPWGAPETERKYRAWCAELLATDGVLSNPAPSKAPLLVSELVLMYTAHAQRYYRAGSAELENIKRAVGALVSLYGSTPATQFAPLGLKALRATWLNRRGAPLSRGTINRYVRHVVRAFRWAAGEGLVPPEVPAALGLVESLKRGRCSAPEGKAIMPVPEAALDAVLAIAPPTVAAMIRVQLLTGARPGEVCALRRADIDTTAGDVWTATLTEHKTAHLEGAPPRVLCFGPQAQAVLKPLMLRPEGAHLFTPGEAVAQRAAAKPTHRREGQKPGKRKTARTLGDSYDTHSYRKAVCRLCKRAGVEVWTPNQLRKLAATRVRERHGLDAAQALLGHSHATVTEVYAKVNLERVIDIARREG